MISALVTVYNPKPENIANINRIAEQADRVFVCDNSSIDNSLMFTGSAQSIIYVPNRRNLGLPAAFNKVLKGEYWSSNEEANDTQWVIFFDQDSNIGKDHIIPLITEFEKINRSKDIGCLGPFYYEVNSDTVQIPKSKNRITENSYTVKSIITSSMLTTYDVIKDVGFWNEDLFLDYADWDLCWRLQKAGMCCCITDVVTLRHSLGQGKKKIGALNLRVAAPIREYYQMRDSRYLLNKNYVPFKYKIRFLINIYLRSVLHVHYFDNGEQRKKYIERAKKDFKKGIRGEFVPD